MTQFFIETDEMKRLKLKRARRARLSRLMAVARAATLLDSKDCALGLAIAALEPGDLTENQ